MQNEKEKESEGNFVATPQKYNILGLRNSLTSLQRPCLIKSEYAVAISQCGIVHYNT